MGYCILVLSLFFILFPVVFIIQDTYFFIPVYEWLDYLLKDSAFDFANWQSLYFSVLVGFVGVYFTIVSIILNKKDITPFTCIKHTFFYHDYIAFFSICINVLLSLFCFPYIRFTNAVLIYLILGITMIMLFFIKAVYFLVYTDREEKAVDHTVKKICYSFKYIKNEDVIKKEIKGFVFDFMFKCFPEKKFKILDNVYEKLTKNIRQDLKLEKIFCFIIDQLEEDELIKAEPTKLYEYIFFITKRLYNLIYDSNNNFDESYSLIALYYKKMYSIYKNYLYNDLVDESYLLQLSEPIAYIYKFNLPVANKDKLLSIFENLLYECKNLIYISLYHCNFETVRDEIHHYMNFVQFLSFTNEYENLLKKHDHYLIDICTHIINIVQLEIVSKKYLLLIEPILKQVQQIDIFPIEYEIYDELLPEISMHEVKYSRNFYIALIWFWYYYETGDLQLLFNKIQYNDNNSNEKIWALNAIKNSLDKIIYSDISNVANNINKEKFESMLDVLKSTLFYEEREENKKYIEKLKNQNYEDVLKKELEINIREFKNEFSYMISNSENTEPIIIDGLTFYFSVKKLMGESSDIFVGYKYNSILIDFLFTYYLRNAEIVNIASLAEIQGISESNEIMLSRDYNKYFYEKKEFEYFGGNLQIENKSFKFNFINAKSKLIVFKKDFDDAFKLEKLEIFEKNRKQMEKIDIRDIFIEIPFKPIFKLTKEKHIAYHLVMD